MPPDDVTSLLLSWSAGDRAAADARFPLLYGELRSLARRQLRGSGANQTLTPTAIVHETYLKLVDSDRVSVRDRGHFFALAARAMRQILVDRARRRVAAKRGGRAWKTDLEAIAEEFAPDRAADVVALDAALTDLAEVDDRLVRVVELRFFAGLSVEEAAEAMETSPRKVKRDWQVSLSGVPTAWHKAMIVVFCFHEDDPRSAG